MKHGSGKCRETALGAKIQGVIRNRGADLSLCAIQAGFDAISSLDARGVKTTDVCKLPDPDGSLWTAWRAIRKLEVWINLPEIRALALKVALPPKPPHSIVVREVIAPKEDPDTLADNCRGILGEAGYIRDSGYWNPMLLAAAHHSPLVTSTFG